MVYKRFDIPNVSSIRSTVYNIVNPPLYCTLRTVSNDPSSASKFPKFQNFEYRKEAFFQIISKTSEATGGPEIWSR